MDSYKIILMQGDRYVFNTHEPECHFSSEKQMNNDNPIYLYFRKETV